MGIPTARRSDATENDADILAAAARLIARGNAVPSIRDVASEAGVGSTTVYRRFSTKEALNSRARAALLSARLEAVVDRALTSPDPMGGLRSITEELIRETARVGEPAPSLPDLVDEFLGRYRAALTHLMREAQSRGSLRPDIVADDIDGVTTVLFAGLALPAHRPGSAARHVSLIFDGLGRLDAPTLPRLETEENAQPDHHSPG